MTSATTHRGGGSRRRWAARPRGERVIRPCVRTRRRGHLAVRMGPARHVAVRSRWAGLLRPPPTRRAVGSGPLGAWDPRAPRAGGRRRGGGSRHLAVRRRGGRLPRPAAVSPRASPRGGPASGSARRGEGRSLAAAPEARDGDLLRGCELLQPAGQRGEARRLLPQVTEPRPAGHAPARPAPGKLRPRGPAQEGTFRTRPWGRSRE